MSWSCLVAVLMKLNWGAKLYVRCEWTSSRLGSAITRSWALKIHSPRPISILFAFNYSIIVCFSGVCSRYSTNIARFGLANPKMRSLRLRLSRTFFQRQSCLVQNFPPCIWMTREAAKVKRRFQEIVDASRTKTKLAFKLQLLNYIEMIETQLRM